MTDRPDDPQDLDRAISSGKLGFLDALLDIKPRHWLNARFSPAYLAHYNRDTLEWFHRRAPEVLTSKLSDILISACMTLKLVAVEFLLDRYRDELCSKGNVTEAIKTIVGTNPTRIGDIQAKKLRILKLFRAADLSKIDTLEASCWPNADVPHVRGAMEWLYKNGYLRSLHA